MYEKNLALFFEIHAGTELKFFFDATDSVKLFVCEKFIQLS